MQGIKDYGRTAIIIKWIIKIMIAIFCVLPIYMVIIIALTPYSNMLEAQLYPKYFEWKNFLLAFKVVGVGKSILNSFVYSISAVALTLIIAIPASFVLSRFRFRARKSILFGILLTQMTSGIVILPTLYINYVNYGLINNHIGIIIALSGFNIALSIWLLVGYFSTIPIELEEAAVIDGATRITVIRRIILPLGLPGIAVSAIFIFINSYNEFIIPLFLLNKASLYPLTVTIYSQVTDVEPLWHMIAASSLIGMIPPILIFIFYQRFIVSGLTAGAIKM